MKVLSIEEKANAYDNVRNKIAARFGSNVAQEIFSEYEESEDEKIRKKIIDLIQEVGEDDSYHVNCFDDMLAWLEKQGEKTKPIEGFDTEFERQISHLIASAIDREHEYNEGYVKWTANALLEYAKRELEKQGEKKCIDDLTQQEAMDIAVAKCFEQGGQKPVDKVEPKFNIGNWIVSDLEDVNEDFRLCKIIGIENGCYTIQSANGCKGYNFFEIWESDYHLWSIEDAKDGDVLATDSWLYIFKYTNNKAIIQFHCTCPINGKPYKWCFLSDNSYLDIYIDANIHPATKEQRDLLSQKMHEAGYTFDFEKKELKKIEPLTDFEKAFQGMCCEKNKQFVKECCKTLIELARKQLQSERNELELDETSYKVGVSRVLENPESYGLTKNYLKPSSSDIEALEDIMNGNSNPTSYLVLQSIIEQLKTLK